MSQLVPVNDLNFSEFIDEPGIYIVDFWSPTCLPCKQIEPGLEKIAAEYSESVKILKVNVDESPMVSSKYFVRGLPTLLFIKDGSVRTQITGSVPPAIIEEKLKEVI
ncbi:MAG: thioredoxin family protein [Candidatus Aminicenantes bacterium]|nr:thioredoxin family protein [Candidatus Aminicenantes bacterium]